MKKKTPPVGKKGKKKVVRKEPALSDEELRRAIHTLRQEDYKTKFSLAAPGDLPKQLPTKPKKQ